ncbi:hypothetical protein D9615_008493 [Tricholomella constricta]|uniref:Uncharacterized protein n=1 Tax=Tricholomella constricta TaxID=117010 RepID=A0A8H5H4J9_9AGAR|nr:hypothetical protein D9615_008493 [Tricholomella constricta]
MSKPVVLQAEPHSYRRLFIHRPGCPSALYEWTTESTDSFFGGAPPSTSARENCYGCRVVDFIPVQTPPPYFIGEPSTLSMRLFKFGFLFPPLWLLGFLIPLLSCHRVEHLVASRFEDDEKIDERYIEELRKVEAKWASRCFTAFGLFLCFGLAAGFLAWWALRK